MKKMNVLALALALTLIASSAFAMTEPVAGEFGFELWDIGVNEILGGPIGKVGGVFACVVGAMLAMRQMIAPGVGVILSGVFLMNAGSFITGIGAVIG